MGINLVRATFPVGFGQAERIATISLDELLLINLCLMDQILYSPTMAKLLSKMRFHTVI